MTSLSKILAIWILAWALVACKSDIDPSGTIDSLPEIWPDYIGVTVPQNIAPLNFHIPAADSVKCGAIIKYGDEQFSIIADADGDIVFPPNRWREMLGNCAGRQLHVTVCRKDGDVWLAHQPFDINISSDSISDHLVYRLIQPLYGTWRYMGIYQRDLQSYEQTPIYENSIHHGNCVNCHSFCSRQPSKMQLHLRGDGGGTYITGDDQTLRLDTKTDSTLANFTYPYWHPSGRYIAYSVNSIFQVFHNCDPNRTEVIDDASDIVVYDIYTNEAFSSPLIKRTDQLETFPAFSADGRRLYFCSAVAPDSLPQKYKDVRYSLCAIDFNPDTRTFGTKVDTLYDSAAGDSIIPPGSMSLPRPSPDGRWLVATRAQYGNFSIWHKDADLWMLDINTGIWQPMTAANSQDVESYHSWSSNSRWLVFSSRRDDGLFTRPYFVHISDDGRVDRPFILPQKHPKKYYMRQMDSFNIPELVDGPVDVASTDVASWICLPSKKVNYSNK